MTQIHDMPSTYGPPFPVVEPPLCKTCNYNIAKCLTAKLQKNLLTKAELSVNNLV